VHVQQQGRVGGLQQQRWVAGVAQRQRMAVRPALQPGLRCPQSPGKFRRLAAQRGSDTAVAGLGQRRSAGTEDVLRRAEGRQQAGCGVTPDARRFKQPQPGGEFVGLQNYGCVKRSPALTGSRTETMSA
jgi:hypothetical protein